MKINKLILIAVGLCAAATMTGCQTRITATKNAEVAHPIQHVVKVNGEDQVIVDQYQVTSGGWEATARSPLYATEALDGLDLGVGTNGTVYLRLGSYNRDLSTNSVAMVREMFSGGAQLVTAIGDAYVKIAGGGAQADTVLSIAKKAYTAFTGGGGDPSKASVSDDGKTLSISDGSICTTCTADGTCSTGACSE